MISLFFHYFGLVSLYVGMLLALLFGFSALDVGMDCARKGNNRRSARFFIFGLFLIIADLALLLTLFNLPLE